MNARGCECDRLGLPSDSECVNGDPCRVRGDEDQLLADAVDTISDLLSWVVNEWEWDQEDYDEADAVRQRIEDHIGARCRHKQFEDACLLCRGVTGRSPSLGDGS